MLLVWIIRSPGIGPSKLAMTVVVSTTSLRTLRWLIRSAFEIYTIVNPGQGVNKTLDGYANYLTSLGDAYGPGTSAFNPTGAFGHARLALTTQ